MEWRGGFMTRLSAEPQRMYAGPIMCLVLPSFRSRVPISLHGQVHGTVHGSCLVEQAESACGIKITAVTSSPHSTHASPHVICTAVPRLHVHP